jgi:hypothetical protein
LSKIKSAPEKKALSIELDRRNTYGENAKASRKNIPSRKQRAHQQERRAVGQILDAIDVSPDPDDVLAAEGAAKVTARARKLKSFKKKPDTPLGEVIERKAARKKNV